MADGKISAYIAARDEADNLPDCLAALQFADEIIVLLDRCSDNSKAIAEAAGARVIEGSFEIEGERRSAAMAACAHEWILEVDADERISPESAAEIRQLVSRGEHDIYPMPVDNYVGTRLVRYGWGGSFGVMANARLFRQGCKVWGNQRVHPKVDFSGRMGPSMQYPLIHFVDRDISDMIRRLDRYSSNRALDLQLSGGLANETYRRNIRRLFSRFYKCYVGRKGYREGKYGFLIALMAGLYPLLSYLKAVLEPQPEE